MKLTTTTTTNYYYYYYYYYSHFTAVWILSGSTQVSWYQKGKTKTNLDFLEQETVKLSKQLQILLLLHHWSLFTTRNTH